MTFSTISSTAKAPGVEVKRARWADLVHQVAIEHGKLIGNMQQGNFYPNINVDPRDSVLPDEKIDLKTMKGYQGGLTSQKTTISDDKVHVRAVNPKADKYIDKMKELAQAAKKRVADRKAKEAGAAASGTTKLIE